MIEIFDLQLGQGEAVFFKVGMEGGQKAFDLSEVVEGSFVRELVEIGLKGIGQIDGPSWNAQRAGNPAVDGKKARQGDERTGGVPETANPTSALACKKPCVYRKLIFFQSLFWGLSMPCLDRPHDLRWNLEDPVDISVLGLWGASFPDSENHPVLCRQDDRGYLMRTERLTQTPP